MKLPPEFDKYANNYLPGSDSFFKRLIGSLFDRFIELKVEILRRLIFQKIDKNRNEKKAEFKLLDYGCGTGELLKWIVKYKIPAKLFGCDVSGEMIKEAVKRWSLDKRPAFMQAGSFQLPFQDNTFDIIIASCVFHHIPLADRMKVLPEIHRTLKKRGIFFLIEHNPLNPITKWMVNKSPLDKNAVLLDWRESQSLLIKSDFNETGADFFLFGPPRFKVLWILDRILSKIPLGGQYVISGVKP